MQKGESVAEDVTKSVAAEKTVTKKSTLVKLLQALMPVFLIVAAILYKLNADRTVASA